MKSLAKLFRYGPGPSSSHTIAPSSAARSFRALVAKLPVSSIEVRLYGSLALTGHGHKTDEAIARTFAPIPCSVIFCPYSPLAHPLSFSFSAMNGTKRLLVRHYASLGGGEVASSDDESVNERDIYPFTNFDSIKTFMQDKKLVSFKDFCLLYEDSSIQEYLETSLKRMFSSIEKGLLSEGIIPANDNPRLLWHRSAKKIHERGLQISDTGSRRDILISSYAYAVSESNASGEEIVTAPTCGSSGVLPAILYYEYHDHQIPFEKVADALYTAGVFGNLVKQNASIAGAIGGCQAEIGTASSMAAAALCHLEGLSLYEEEYAAECAMEHFLGLSCDPVDGYVIIPCIERNGMGALRAYDSFLYAKYIAPLRKNQVSFDDVVAAMKLTGDSLASAYKETAEGGLAEILSKQEQLSKHKK